MKYKKKPEFVEAVQWDGRDETYQEIKKMNGGEVYRAGVWDNELGIAITTQAIRAKTGDYIVKFPSREEVYRFDAKKFEAMYEPLVPVNCEPTQESESIPVEPCWQERMQAEYHDLKTRYEKLHRMVTKYEAGTLDFTPNCSIDLLRQQKRHMGEYLHDLEIRAEIEGVEL
jgi:hypothetical protein